jgi:hypothetical protein
VKAIQKCRERSVHIEIPVLLTGIVREFARKIIDCAIQCNFQDSERNSITSLEI